MIRKLICSKASLRRIAILLNIDRKTVVRKFLWHAAEARKNHAKRLSAIGGLTWIQMDEMESFEHSKCKQLSIAITVNPYDRMILGASVAIMPTKGRLAEISRKKYGFRPDQRKDQFLEVLKVIKPLCLEKVTIMTDKKPAYVSWIKTGIPFANHVKVKGRRGCVVGYDELKRGGWDPFFDFNHSAAMIRDNLARMLRKTWCTTKKKQFLQEALDLYIDFHNDLVGAN